MLKETRNQLTLLSSLYKQPEKQHNSKNLKINLLMQSCEINFTELFLPFPLCIQSAWVIQRGWVHSNQEIQVWGFGAKCGQLCGWNAFLPARSPPSYTPLLCAPQLTPLWHIQWSAVAVIPTERPRWASSTPVVVALASQTEHTVYREIYNPRISM